MHAGIRGAWGSAVAVALLGAVLSAQAPKPAAPPAKPEGHAQQPSQTPPRSDQVIRARVDLVTTDVIVRDSTGQFVADLKKGDFEVFEDEVKQELVSFVLSHGGRIFNVARAAAAGAGRGIILPPPRPTNDAAGRIFLIFVDDLHLDFRNTPRIRDLFKKIAQGADPRRRHVRHCLHRALVARDRHDLRPPRGSTRRSRRSPARGLTPKDILDVPDGAQGPPEVRYRAHVAFSTAYDIMGKLQQVHNRRKAFIYVSNGYDFDPFATSRAKESNERYSAMTGRNNRR